MSGGRNGWYTAQQHRFIKVDRNDLIQDLVKQERSLLEDLVALEKKQGYMQKELTNAQGNLKDVFQSRS